MIALDSPSAVVAPLWTVLCVDDEPNILSALRRMLRGTGYRVLLAGSGAEALRLMDGEPVHLVISDMRMPGMDGAQLLEQVRLRWPDATRMLLTGHADVGSTIAAINCGEIFRYITKPWNEDELLRATAEAIERQALLREKVRLEGVVAVQNAELSRLNTGLEAQVAERTSQLSAANARLDRNYLASIKAFSNLIELRAGTMAGHSRRVAELARRIAVELRLPAPDVQDVFVAGLLHDIGQVGLPDALLACPVPRMSPADRVQFEKHAAFGEQALLALEDMTRIAALVRSHHERHDGRGFPERLAGDAIPAGARILALADTFDDLQSGGLSRSPLGAEEARLLIARGAGSQFDDEVVSAFMAITRQAAKPPPSIELPVEDLKPGKVLACDLRSAEGAVLLAAGHVLGAELIERVVAYGARNHLALRLAVQNV